MKLSLKNGEEEVEVGFKPDLTAASSFAILFPELAPGAYALEFSIIGADGHTVAGHFNFGPGCLLLTRVEGTSARQNTLLIAVYSSMASAIWTLFAILAKLGIFAGMIASAGGLWPFAAITTAAARLMVDCCPIAFWRTARVPFQVCCRFLYKQVRLTMQASWACSISILFAFARDPGVSPPRLEGVGFALSALLVLALLKTLNTQRKSPEPAFYHIASLGQALALALVAYGFTLSGHISLLESWVRAALTNHVAAMGIWLGMLLLCVGAVRR